MDSSMKKWLDLKIFLENLLPVESSDASIIDACVTSKIP